MKTRAEVARELRKFADEFEHDAPGDGYADVIGWIVKVAHLDTDGRLVVATEILCWPVTE